MNSSISYSMVNSQYYEFKPYITNNKPVSPLIEELNNKAVRISLFASTVIACFTFNCNASPIINPLIRNKPDIFCVDTCKYDINENNIFTTTVLNTNMNTYNKTSKFEYDSEKKSVGGEEMSNSMIKNLNKIDEFARLEMNWNGYGAIPFTGNLLDLSRNIIKQIKIQPKVFPTGRQSIQFEYENNSGKYLELEIFEDHTEVFCIHENGEEEEFDIENSIGQINKVVEIFDGHRN